MTERTVATQTHAMTEVSTASVNQESVDLLPQSFVHEESLMVLSGTQAGATMQIGDKDVFTIGTGYDCDVVLRTTSGNTVKVLVERYRDVRRLQLLEGSATLDGEPLLPDSYNKLSAQSKVSFDEVSFHMSDMNSTTTVNQHEATVRSAPRSWVATAALGAGFLLLGAVGMQSYWQASANHRPAPVPFEQRLAALDIDSVQLMSNPDNSLSIVSGRVADRETFRQLHSIVNAETPPVALDVQIDAVFVESLQDVYRNHGITPAIEVMGRGHVKVDTVGVHESLLLELEKTLKEDLPQLSILDSRNTPPELSPELAVPAVLDPAKEVEAVIAGESSYVITRDQARYFVGATLPSGHVISSISEGVVVMLRDGEETQLNF